MVDSWASVSLPYVRARGPNQPEAWAAEAAEHGNVGTQQLLEVAEMPAPSRVAEALRHPLGTPVVVRRRLMLLDNEPVELTTSYYPTDIARGTPLAQARKIRGGATTALSQLGHQPSRVQEDVWPAIPVGDVQALLKTPPGEPALVLFRVVFSKQDRPVEVSEMTMRHGHLRYALTIT